MIFLKICIFFILIAWAASAPLENNEDLEITDERDEEENGANLDTKVTEENLKSISEQDPEQIGDYFEGDMDLELTRNGIISPSRKWPNGEVFYKFDEAFDSEHQLQIVTAMQTIENATCVQFIPATDDITEYVLITAKPSGCHSGVGYYGKIQNLNFQLNSSNNNCFRQGVIIHELLHTLGFRHQQGAHDRDDYVRIVYENIAEGKEKFFQKFSEEEFTQFGIEYDYYSIMHYARKSFSKNRNDTIIPIKDPQAKIGQRIAMSDKDIAKVNLMYKCPVINNHSVFNFQAFLEFLNIFRRN